LQIADPEAEVWATTMMTVREAISKDPEILGGTTCFAGTRVPIRNLFDYLEGGNSIDYFLESFNWISRDQVLAVLEYSASNDIEEFEDLAETLQPGSYYSI
jgi:uncharacterized protein (DUF433 family)